MNANPYSTGSFTMNIIDALHLQELDTAGGYIDPITQGDVCTIKWGSFAALKKFQLKI